MPGKVKVKILAGRNLPVMDRSSDTTDAYVEIKLGNTTYKTDVCRKSLNPQWNSEWYKFEMDDAELQDEPLQIRLMDHDTYSANDSIGKVYLNLNPLLLPPSSDSGPPTNPKPGGSTMSGWLPVYDTMHGIRGEVNVVVKVELFSDFNKFRQSSCGVQFFFSETVPYGFDVSTIHGLVEELIVAGDPEYQWIEKIRAPRVTNESRQTLFAKLSGEVQRKIGLKVLDLGANAVIGYKQCFDLEGESGIVVRGLGTAVTLAKGPSLHLQPPLSAHPAVSSIEDTCESVPFSPPTPPLPSLEVIISPATPKHNHGSTTFVDRHRIPNAARSYSSDPFSYRPIKTRYCRSTKSLSDEIIDNSTLKSLLDQEDQRGEPSSGTQKFFRAISLFPKTKMKQAFKLKQPRKQNPPETIAFLIKSVMESGAILDRVSESDEHADLYFDDTPKLKYDDGHLLPVDDFSSSSSDSSLSELEDASDVSSINVISQTSMRSKSDEEPLIESGSVSDSSRTSDPSTPRLRRPPTSTNPIDGGTPPLSEMDFIVPVSSTSSSHNTTIYEETIISKEGGLKLTVTQPSLDSDMVDDNISFNYNDENNEDYDYDVEQTDDDSYCFDKQSVKYDVSEGVLIKLGQSPPHGSPKFIMNYDKTDRTIKLDEHLLAINEHFRTTFTDQDIIFPSSSKEQEKMIQVINYEDDRKFSTDFQPFTAYTNLPYSSLGSIDDDNNSSLVVADVGQSKESTTVSQELVNKTVEISLGEDKTCKNVRRQVSLDSDTISQTSKTSDSDQKSKSIPNNDSNTVINPTNSSNLLSLSNALSKHVGEPFVSPLSKSCSDSKLMLCELASNTSSLLTPLVPPSSKQDDTKPAKAPQTAATSHSPARLTSLSANIHRRSSDSDLSITPKGNSLTGSDKSSLYGGNRGFHQAFPRATILKEHLEMLEYPFFTMSKYPPGFIIHIGGMVGARSVKLIERMNNMEEPVCRDSWWTEIRKEVRTHCRALGCNVVLNYTESTTICDDVCVLSVSGTAAVIQVRGEGGGGPNSVVFADPLEQPPLLTWHKKPAQSQPPVQAAAEKTADSEHDGSAAAANRSTRQRNLSENVDSDAFLPCSICHVAFNHKSVSFHMELSKCINCKKKMVPDILLASIEPPEGLPIAGRGCFIQAFEVRPKGAGRGESNAKEISDGLPFMEFEINKQLVSKLRLSGMNAIFGLKIEVSVGERMVAAHATGTAFMVTCLPVPRVPSVAAGQAFQGNSKLAKVQQMLHDTVKKNRDYYQLRLPSVGNQEVEQSETVADKGENNGEGSESEDSDEDDNANLDPFHGNKEAFILEVDDTHEADSISLLIDPHPPEGFHVVTIECLPNVENLEVVRNLQMFTLVWRSRLPLSYSQMPSAHFNKHFHRLLQGVYFKLRRMTPCALASMCFKIDLPEQDELQITAVGMALGLAESESHGKKENKKKTNTIPNEGVGEMIFSLEEDQNECSPKQSKGSTAPSPTSAATTLHPNKTGAHRSHSPLRPIRRSTHTPPKERYGVDLTPLSYVPGGRIDKYLGNLSFYFIRESTCIRESGGQSGFVHSFLAEVLAIVRAHVTALGGNAMVAYTMSDCTLLNYPAKNHAQCLVNVSGDAVFVSYFPNE
ncbi:C2 domain-containing protein 5 isoform X2 [Nilaparvata lugens]|uniref:C2 domain-containing protein 5 isoform X2 n=1 Tax=Nilaparvata lugens TaxID=108931 RepID=UPI00193D03BF|nr:C2 domain-containing protein 5 isoform X2 [Nilaparvata lugens]